MSRVPWQRSGKDPVPQIKQPVAIEIFGRARVDLKLVDPSRPAWRYA